MKARPSFSVTQNLHYIIPFSIYLVALVYFVSLSPYSLYDFPLDDAWIHRVYSRSFAFGQGFQYNPGTQEAGSTSPLWAIITAPAHWLEPFGTRSVVVAVKEIGILLGFIILREIILITYGLTGSWKSAIIAGSLFAVEPRFLFSVLSGMETVLLLALWLSASRFYMAQRWLLSAFLFSLAPPTRPEALIILPFWLVGLFFLPSKERPPSRHCAYWLIAGIPMGVWSLFCWFTNGYWLPTTFYVKSRVFQIGPDEIQLAGNILSQHGYATLHIFIVGISSYLIWSLVRFDFQAKSGLLYFLIAPVLYALGVVGSRTMTPYGYYWTRWLDPVSLLLTFSFCMGYSMLLALSLDLLQVWRLRKRVFSQQTIVLGTIGLASIIGMALAAPSFTRSFAERQAHFATDSRAIHLINVLPGQWINQNTAQEAKVAVNDAGAIRYFGNRWTLDLIGLNSAEVVFGQKPAVQLIEELSIDWLVIFPSWFQGSAIFQNFTPHASFQISPVEYTICPCPGQTRMVIFKKVD